MAKVIWLGVVVVGVGGGRLSQWLNLTWLTCFLLLLLAWLGASDNGVGRWVNDSSLFKRKIYSVGLELSTYWLQTVALPLGYTCVWVDTTDQVVTLKFFIITSMHSYVGYERFSTYCIYIYIFFFNAFVVVVVLLTT